MRMRALLGALLAIAASGLGAGTARAGGLAIEGAASSATAPGSPYRYTAISPGTPGKLTVVARTDRRGGKVSRWWHLPGSYYVPAVDYHGTGGGLSADGGTLVLRRFSPATPPRRTLLAVLDTEVHLRHPLRPGQHRPLHAISRIDLRGQYSFAAISPHGSTAYVTRYLLPRRNWRPRTASRFQVRALDTASGKLQRGSIAAANAPREPLQGLPISQTTSADGHAYTLYDGGDEKRPFILALDTVSGSAFRLDLPGLRSGHNLFLLRLALRDDGRRLALLAQSPRQGGPTRRLMSIKTGRLTPAAPGGAASAAGGSSRFLAFTRTPRGPNNLMVRVGVVGHSIEGRPIKLRQVGDPAIGGRLMIFGCIHGNECAASVRVEPLANGCPDPRVNTFIVPDLDPDGSAAGSRVNGRGVDLNRNFPAGWRPAGSRGELEYPGPAPFSEPETRLAARLVRTIGPRATIWFHQDNAQRPFVRAWGESRAAGRRFAQLADIAFRSLPWPAGTAPNWQNHRFPGSASFVVELPPGKLTSALEVHLDRAVDLFGREVGED